MVFEVFRSRQKELLVALTLLAMFAFVFAGVLEQFTSRELGANPTLAVAWGKDITVSDVQYMQQDRNLANQFLTRALLRVGVNRPIGFDTSPQGVIRGIAILEKAEAMGIVVDDEMVTQFINELTANRLSKGDFIAVLAGKDMEGASPIPVSERELYRILARELKIQRAIVALTPPVLLDTPYELWAGRELAGTKVKLDVASVPVEKFASDVGAPTDEQLKQTYDKYKDQAPDPEAGVIGFRTPHRVEAQYLIAKVDDFVSKVSVTPEEMKEYYDAHPEEFQPEPPKPPATTPAEEETPIPPSEEMPKEEETPTPPKEASEEKDDSTPKKEEDKPADKTEVEDKAAQEKEGEESPSDENAPTETSPEKAEEPQAESKDEPQARTGWRSIASTVSAVSTYLLAQSDEKTGEGNPSQELPAEPKPEPPAPPSESSEKTEPAPETAPQAKPDDIPSVTEGSPGQEPPKVDAPAPPRPFEEVKGEIEKKLLRQKAGDYIVGNMQKVILDVMQPYLDKYLEAFSAFDEKKSGEKFVPPPLPDLEKVASEYGYQLKSTGLITQEEAAAIDGLGSATRPQRGDDPQFSIAVFDQKMFRPRVVESSDGNQYFLYWKTEDQPSKVPPFDDIKEEVIAAWRTEAAGPKANEAAEKLAEAARAEGANFTALAEQAGFKTATTGEFTRYVTQPNPMLGQESWMAPEIPELPSAGPELLNEIFKMKVGEIKVVADALGKNYYVVKLLSRKEPDFDNFVQHYSMEVGFLRDPSFLTQRREYQLQYELTRLSIVNESGLKLTKTGEDYLGVAPATEQPVPE